MGFKFISIFAVRQSFKSTVFIQFLGNYTIRRSFSHSLSSAFGGCRKLGRATLFLLLIVIFLLMRQPVNKNCTLGNNSTCTATCVHETNIPTYCQFTTAWQKLNENYDASENIPEVVKQNLMNLTATIIGLHQQSGSQVELTTASAIDWLNNLYNFFNELTPKK